MWPSHFKLERAIRSHILALSRYFTSTSDEFGSRPSILLDANENALGSPFGKAVGIPGEVVGCSHRPKRDAILDHPQDLDVRLAPLPSHDVSPPGALKRAHEEYDSTSWNKRPCYDAREVPRLREVTPSTRTSREASVDPSNADSSSSASSPVSNDLALEDIGTDALDTLHRYPSAAQLQLKCRIAEWKGLSDIRGICLGVGAAELIDAVIRLACTPSVDAILTTPPTFGLYQVRALVNDVGVFTHPLCLENDVFVLSVPDLLQKIAANPQIKLIFLASPGNPTGSLISLHAIRQILSCPDFHGILVVDEAYIDFSETSTTGSALNLLDEFPNLLVLQTASKTLGLAGIRLGMAFGHSCVIENLQKVQTPYCIATPTAALALRALSPTFAPRREEALATLRANRTVLLRQLAEMRGQGVDIGAPIGGCEANFITVPILIRLEEGTAWERDNRRAKHVTELLKREHAIAIRYVGDLHGCEGCVRVTVGTERENGAFCEALRTILRND